jgi:hypothetical protein
MPVGGRRPPGSTIFVAAARDGAAQQDRHCDANRDHDNLTEQHQQRVVHVAVSRVMPPPYREARNASLDHDQLSFR